MSRSAEKQARCEAMLGELAEVSLMVAKELAVRLRESEDTDETVALAGAFQKMSRVVRLTLALDAKLERDAVRDALEAARIEAERLQAQADAELEAEAEDDLVDEVTAELNRFSDAAPVENRKARVRKLLYRLLWNESEGDSEEFEVLQEDLDARLDEVALAPAFETTPIELTVQRLVADMGFTSPFTLTVGEPPPGKAGARQPQSADTG